MGDTMQVRCWQCNAMLPPPGVTHSCGTAVQPYPAGATAMDNAMRAIERLQAECARLKDERDAAYADAEQCLHQRDRQTERGDRATRWAWGYRKQSRAWEAINDAQENILRQMNADMATACDDLDALRAALAKYGRHIPGCDVFFVPFGEPCTCGLDAAMETAPQPREGTLTPLEAEK